MCLNPKIAYQRRKMPIDGNYSEKNLKRLNKLSFTYKEGWTQVELPCGQCDECRLQKANDWATRIVCEGKEWDNKGIFVTLTYRPENLPLSENGFPTLKKKDMQDFKKRLRKYISKNNEAIKYWENPKTHKIEKPIRTFECGEYGDKNGRPHYHQIIFNWIPKDLKFYKMSPDNLPLYKSKTLKKIWGNGKIIIGMISYESASYVARYTMKKNGLAKTKREYYDTFEYDEEIGEIVPVTKYRTQQGEIQPEFITMSTAPGLGYKYFIDNKELIKKNNCIEVKSNKGLKLKRIPRYFRKIWEKLDWEEYENWKYQYKNQIDKLTKEKIDKYKLPDNWHFWQKETFVKQKETQMKISKYQLLKRDRANDEIYEKNDLATDSFAIVNGACA